MTIVTQVAVDPTDPSIKNPSKFIGPHYTKKQAENLAINFNWVIKEDSGRGYRRVVPSPTPLKIINRRIIKQLVDRGVIVITAGGGGIPVYVEIDGTYEGVDAVIDKDRASSVLALDIKAQTLVILTDVENVCLNYNKSNQRILKHVKAATLKKYFHDGHFPPGNMGPKIEAAIHFLENGGTQVIITSLDRAKSAILGNAGTKIIP